jgi:hypothetical protein
MEKGQEKYKAIIPVSKLTVSYAIKSMCAKKSGSEEKEKERKKNLRC